MYVTRHAEMRIRERLGIPKSAVKRNAAKALSEGIPYCETNGPLKIYLQWLFLQKQEANNIRVMCRYVYLFQEELLITVIQLPSEYRKIADKLTRRKKSNA